MPPSPVPPITPPAGSYSPSAITKLIPLGGPLTPAAVGGLVEQKQAVAGYILEVEIDALANPYNGSYRIPVVPAELVGPQEGARKIWTSTGEDFPTQSGVQAVLEVNGLVSRASAYLNEIAPPELYELGEQILVINTIHTLTLGSGKEWQVGGTPTGSSVVSTGTKINGRFPGGLGATWLLDPATKFTYLVNLVDVKPQVAFFFIAESAPAHSVEEISSWTNKLPGQGYNSVTATPFDVLPAKPLVAVATVNPSSVAGLLTSPSNPSAILALTANQKPNNSPNTVPSLL